MNYLVLYFKMFPSLDTYNTLIPTCVLFSTYIKKKVKFCGQSTHSEGRTCTTQDRLPTLLGYILCARVFLTWGHRASSWLADMRTNFTPSSLFEMEQAKLATCVRGGRKQNTTVRIGVYFPLEEPCLPSPNSDQ